MIRHIDAMVASQAWRPGAMRKWRFISAFVLFLLVALTAQGNYGMYLGYEVEGDHCFVDGINLHYTDQGSGEPVILLHGYAMTSDITWRESGAMAPLLDSHRVITLDMRGHGLSDKPYSPGSYGVQMARDVVRLMDCLGIDRAHVVGNSLGALVAIKTATLFPERVISLVACGMGWARYTGEKREVIEALAKSLEDGEGLSPLVRYLRPIDDPPGWMELSAIDALVGYFNDEQALLAMTRQMPELEVSEQDLRNLPMPVLSIVAARDPLVPDVEELVELVPGAQMSIIEGEDHFTLTGAEEMHEVLESFLSTGRVALEAAASMS